MRPTKVSQDGCNPLESAAESTALIIGIGNPLCGDDSAGRIIATHIKEQHPPFVRAVECSGEGTGLMELWEDAGTVIVVDAVASGAVAGTIYRFDATQQALPVRFFGGSTHDFGLVEALELARALNQLPKHLIVFGVEGKRFDIGSKLSTEVEKIIPHVVDRVLEEARLQLKVG
jgi:hydrogenase maturation protease